MAQLSWFQRLYWRHFAKPAAHRELFRYLLEHPVGSILEIGIGNGERLKQVLTLATRPADVPQLRYAGVDPFESGVSSEGHLRLKDVHRMLAERNVKAHLIPGDVSQALMRVSHNVLPSDLIIVDHGWEQDSDVGEALARWLPRLVNERSIIFARTVREESLTQRTLAIPSSVRQAA